jgi:uncharacterized protein
MPYLIANEADLIRAREAYVSGLIGPLDQKRPRAWTVYGYPTDVTFAMLLSAYQRGGPAHGAVHRLLDKCWQAKPRIKKPNTDKPSQWEKDLDKLLTSIGGWQKLRDFDRRNMVGRFAALIYRVRDGQALREPLVRGQALVDLVPVYEDQIRVEGWNSDQLSEDFGKPTMFQIRTRSPGASAMDTQGKPEEWISVHPSRVQILAEGSVGDFFEGVPLLLAGFNSLVDLEKITGGSAESYHKNSARNVVIKFDPDASPSVITQNADGTQSTKSVREVIEEQMQALNRNLDASMVLQGADASTLQTTTHDPSGAWEVAACTFAASVQIPFTILFGQQTGRLASDEDKADWAARCASRQTNELTPMLTELVTRLQAAGLVEAGEFEIEWQDLAEPSDAQKLERAEKMAKVNQTQSAAGQPAAFDGNEIRAAAGYEERDELAGLPLEGDPDDIDPVTGEPTQPAGAKAKAPPP